jgi:hypothetical protein
MLDSSRSAKYSPECAKRLSRLNLRTSEYIMTFKTKALLTWMGIATPAGPQVALLLGKPENGPLLRDR